MMRVMRGLFQSSETVSDCKEIAPSTYDFVFAGDDLAQASLVKELVEAGVGIVNFTQKSTLETAMKALAEEA